jgi:hypothetical protein
MNWRDGLAGSTGGTAWRDESTYWRNDLLEAGKRKAASVKRRSSGGVALHAMSPTKPLASSE